MNIDEMPAGKEMDTLIANKIMGWVQGSISVKDPPDPGWAIWKTGMGKTFTIHTYIDAWYPSANFAAAQEVIERLDELHAAWFEVRGPRGWQAHCNCPGGKRYSAVAETPSLAVCRAALKAISALDLKGLQK